MKYEDDDLPGCLEVVGFILVLSAVAMVVAHSVGWHP